MQESSPTYLSVMHADGDILVKNDYKIPEGQNSWSVTEGQAE